MRQSRYFLFTLREAPRDADVISQQLMMRAGMIRKVAAGIYDYLPLALRSIRKFESIVREELNRDGCQELLMPTVQPKELWEESGRWQFYGKELLRFKDRKDAEFCLGPTHEEVITDIVRGAVRSYKQLPLNLYQIQTKFRDEIRPRFGLMRGREFVMKDGYSFHVDDADADREYWRMFEAYKRIFRRLGVKFRPVEADSGAIGGSFTHEFHVLADTGEDAILSCSAANTRRTSRRRKRRSCRIAYATEAGARPAARTLPHPGHHGDGRSGARVPRRRARRPAARPRVQVLSAASPTRRRIDVGRRSGPAERPRAEPRQAEERHRRGLAGARSRRRGRASRRCTIRIHRPVDLGVPTYVDRSLEGAFNLTCGANKDGYHHFGFKPDRDLPALKGFYDLRMAREGDRCTRCASGHYEAYRGIEVGQVFKLGTKYSSSMSCTFLDEHGSRTADGDGLLRHRRHAHDCRSHRAEPRRGRHHLAVAGGAVPRAPRRASMSATRRSAPSPSTLERDARSGRVRSPVRRPPRPVTGREVQGRRPPRHAAASDGRREGAEGRDRRAARSAYQGRGAAQAG